MIHNSVWSAYGHRFIGEDGHESCLTCGAIYDLVATPDATHDAEYVAANGDAPVECTGDTSLTHGEEAPAGSTCNCLLCA